MLSAGFLDTSFGNGGVASAHFGTFVTSSAIGAVVQQDGKIVVAGTALTNGLGPSLALARFNANGTLDNSFGTGGEVTTPGGTAVGVVLQADGKIVVGGTSIANSFLVARYNADGSLDANFGTGGLVTTIVNAKGDSVSSVLLQPDRKIVLVGFHHEFGAGIDFSNTELVRYNTDGSLDTSFGKGGEATDFTFTGTAGTAALQSDGKIVVPETSGTTFSFPLDTTWFLVRINSDGSQDTSFSSTIDFGRGSNKGIAVAIQADSKIVATGVISHQSAMARVNPDGTLDTTFGINGKLLTPVSGNLAIQPTDGRILLSGASSGSPLEGLLRYLPDGSLDTRFGIDGSASSFPTGLEAGLTLQPDGSILVIGGVVTPGNNADMAVGGYQGGASAALTGTLNQRFVEQVYLDVLERPVDSSGLAFWSGLLDRGQANRTQVVFDIEQSAEYHSLVIENLYNLYLGRPADQTGLSAWNNFLAAGGTTDQLRALLLGSDEYARNHFDGNSALSFVEGVYHDVLYRTPDNAGAMGWNQALTNGASRTAVAAAIIRSAEGNSDEVQDLYHRLLHRAPDAGGLNLFSNALAQGVSNDLILALIAGSDEYAAQL